MTPISVLYHESSQNTETTLKAECKDTVRQNELLSHKDVKGGYDNSLPMEVDSNGSSTNKRRRISSHSKSPESMDNNGSTNDDKIRLLLTSKLSNCYKTLVESSKLDVDGMIIHHNYFTLPCND